MHSDSSEVLIISNEHTIVLNLTKLPENVYEDKNGYKNTVIDVDVGFESMGH